MPKIRRAVLSCYDKTGIVELARLLRDFDVEIVSTTGTRKVLRDAGLPVLSIEDFTGVPEMMNGRVKTLLPKIHAGLLGIRDSKLHVEHMQAYDLQWIDLVVVNQQPVPELLTKPGITPEEVYEQIDIGGTAMIRSAAKNFRYVTVVVNPERYSTIMHELRAHEGSVSFATRNRLAREAFEATAAYDQAIAEYFTRQEPPRE